MRCKSGWHDKERKCKQTPQEAKLVHETIAAPKRKHRRLREKTRNRMSVRSRHTSYRLSSEKNTERNRRKADKILCQYRRNQSLSCLPTMGIRHRFAAKHKRFEQTDNAAAGR